MKAYPSSIISESPETKVTRQGQTDSHSNNTDGRIGHWPFSSCFFPILPFRYFQFIQSFV